MESWILIIWAWSGSSSVPAVPARAAAYQNKEQCEIAAQVWRAAKGSPGFALRDAVCLPGR